MDPAAAAAAANAMAAVAGNAVAAAGNVMAVAGNAVALPAVPAAAQGQRIDKWLPLVQAALTQAGVNVEAFSTLLKKHNALIAGGFVLLAATGDLAKAEADGNDDGSFAEPHDIDIYVPVKEIPAFYETIKTGHTGPNPILAANKNITHEDSFMASAYCRSFLRKNGIRKIYTLVHKPNARQRTPPDFKLDIMSVRNKRTPLAVVNNFDLTCCQVWYDGEAVYASHPDHIEGKTAFLQPEYIDTFLSGNRFLAKRLKKYSRRGFTITYSPQARELPPIDQILKSRPDPRYTCTNPTHTLGYQRLTDAVWMADWAKRIQKRWVSGVRNYPENKYLFVPLTEARREDMVLPTEPQRYRNPRSQIFRDINRRTRLALDDGYDTDDIDDEALKSLAIINSPAAPEGTVELASVPLDPDLLYNRIMMNLLINVYTPLEAWTPHAGSILFATYPGGFAGFNMSGRPQTRYAGRRIRQYVEYLKTAVLTEGTDGFYGEGLIYHIHNHPVEAGITSDSLETYLTPHLLDEDKESIPCFHKPDPVPRGGNPPSPRNCTLNLTRNEIHAIVSEDFFRRWVKPAPMKLGLNQIIGAYDTTLADVKTHDEDYGDLFGATMCPFCLQYEQREGGCAYVTHVNSKRLPASEAPFCRENFVVPAIKDKYIALAKQIDPNGFVHIEFCVECGRPCMGHQHFNLDDAAPGVVNNMMVADAAGRQHIDYGTCTGGGGRVELFARILAVRDVYAAGGPVRSAAEERAAAAAAADAAPKNAALMARAKAIFDVDPDARKWNRPIPSRKTYTDEAYAASAAAAAEGQDNDGAAAIAAVAAAEGVGGAGAAAAPAAAPQGGGGSHRRRTKKLNRRRGYTRRG